MMNSAIILTPFICAFNEKFKYYRKNSLAPNETLPSKLFTLGHKRTAQGRLIREHMDPTLYSLYPVETTP